MGVGELSSECAPVAVFVCSADSRRDVLDRTLLSVMKFWPDCPYPFYVGVNTAERPLPIGIPVLAGPSGWHSECALQLAQLREKYLIVILDDFLLSARVDQRRVSDLVNITTALNLDYLRLIPLGRSLFARVTGQRLHQMGQGVEQIGSDHPFYSALQIAIWRKEYLQPRLSAQRSIWEFERECPTSSVHCAITCTPPFIYQHLVERGLWLPHARLLLRQAGLPSELGDRPAWPNSRYLRLLWDHARWLVKGYANW